MIGSINNFNDKNNMPQITVPRILDSATEAKAICATNTLKIGDQVAIMFEASCRDTPIIMGVLQQTMIAFPPLDELNHSVDANQLNTTAKKAINL